MNNQLKALYKEKLGELVNKLEDYNFSVNYNKKATNPFLLKAKENYSNYKNKVMIFGQETNSWCQECGNRSVFSNNLEKSIEVYEKFYLEGGINKYRGPFFNEFKRIKNELEKNSDTTVLWNNINKIGRIGKGNLRDINEIQFKYLQVIKKEIEILEPKVLVFFTGPKYDFFIKNNIGEFKSHKISEHIQKLEFDDALVGFKTYHPNALYFKGINKEVIPKLIDEVKKILS